MMAPHMDKQSREIAQLRHEMSILKDLIDNILKRENNHIKLAAMLASTVAEFEVRLNTLVEIVLEDAEREKGG